jgi:hypothetical protein
MLTDERIAKTLGFSEYTTESTKATLTSIARAIEAEATAPLLARIAELEAEAKRLDFVESRLFGKSWNGVIDSGSRTYWRVASDHRHITQKMVGHTFRDALDNAMKEQP